MLGKKNILGIDITDASRNDILEYVVENIENFKEKIVIVTPNPEFLVLASKNITFKNILNRADLALADGVGVTMAAKIMSKPLKSRFTGVDFVKSLCSRVAEKPITVGFLGGRDSVAEKTAECLQKMHPKLKIAFVGEEWPIVDLAQGPVTRFTPVSAPSTLSVRAAGSPFSRATPSQPLSPPNYTLDAKRYSLIDILFVAYGAPKQEFWIDKNLKKLPVKVVVGVGGTFDYISGKIPRAPKFVRSIGLEWLFRLAVQPWRIKRQLSLLKFIYLVIKGRMKT